MCQRLGESPAGVRGVRENETTKNRAFMQLIYLHVRLHVLL